MTGASAGTRARSTAPGNALDEARDGIRLIADTTDLRDRGNRQVIAPKTGGKGVAREVIGEPAPANHPVHAVVFKNEGPRPGALTDRPDVAYPEPIPRSKRGCFARVIG